MKNVMRIFTLVLSGMLGVALTEQAAFAQTTTTSTTLSATVTNPTPAITQQTLVCLASATNVVTPNLSTGLAGSILVVDREAMQVLSAPTTTCFQVKRGVYGSTVSGHASGQKVWVGAMATNSGDPGRPITGGPFIMAPPSGSCTTANLQFTDYIIVGEAYGVAGLYTGDDWQCPASGPQASNWVMVTSPSSTFSLSDGIFFVSPQNCVGATTGTAGTGNGTLIVDGNVPALKISATNAGASVNTFTCEIHVPSRLTTGKGVSLTNIDFLYSVQTTTATSQTLSTMKSFTGPAPAASETASSATLVAAGGTVTQVPAVASANLTAVSAGQYYTSRASFGTPILVNTDEQVFVFTFVISQSASAAQIVTSPGMLVHYVNVPL